MAIKQCDQRKGGMEGGKRNGEAEDRAISITEKWLFGTGFLTLHHSYMES